MLLAECPELFSVLFSVFVFVFVYWSSETKTDSMELVLTAQTV